jgi:hypothetical protein
MEAVSVARFTRASFTPFAWARAFSILATQLAQCMPEMERSSLLNDSFPTDGFFSPIKRKVRRFKAYLYYAKIYKKVAQEKQEKAGINKKSFHVRRNHKDAKL